MLYLLGAEHGWRTDGGLRPLPDTLPGWTIAYLAVNGDWIARERLCALLWPQASPAEAQHSLRMNLHRMRGLLSEWGQADALQAERRRVRLSLPTDVAALRRACDGGAAPVAYPGALLEGVACDCFPALREWLELERTALTARWRQAQLAALDAGDPASEQTVAIARALLAVDALDDIALARLLAALRTQGRDGEADRHYAEYRERLARELGAEPSPALRALASGAALAAERAVPPAPAFVGRRLELAELDKRFAAGARLVTLVGPGGVGKSALAREWTARSAQATVWIDLQDLADIDGVAARIAQRIGARLRDGEDAAAQLASALGPAPRWLALDNAEHLHELPGFVTRLLAASPAVRVLVTSRAPLALAEESVFALSGLALPDEESRDAEAAQAFDAVRLFAQRAQTARADFDPARHVAAVIEIAEAVDGLPLALELAAGWVRYLAPATIARELRQSLEVLAREPQAPGLPARPEHLSMTAVLARTWSLLAPAEARALEALSVFEGGFTRPAAAAVAEAPLPLLSALADRGLLRVDPDGRFDMHPLVRQHAHDRLAGDAARALEARDRHASHFATHLSESAQRHASDDQRLIEGLHAELANAGAAWRHARQWRRYALLMRMAPVWRRYFEVNGRYAEACRFFEPLDVDSSAEATLALAALQINRAHFLIRQGAAELALPIASEALALADAHGDDALVAGCTATLGGCMIGLGRFDEAAHWFGRALEMHRQSANRAAEASALNSLTLACIYRGRPDEALRHLEDALALHRSVGQATGIARALVYKAQLLLWPAAGSERADKAAATAREALQVAVRHGLPAMAILAGFYQGLASLAQRDWETARDHFRRCRERCSEQTNEVFAFKVDYHLTYLDCVDAGSGDAASAQRSLLAAARMASEKGYDEDLLYIALFLAERLQDAGHMRAARRLANSVLSAPQPPADALLHAHARHALAALPADASAVAGLPFERLAHVLAASQSLAELARRLSDHAAA
ncbi:MAG: tetratricopeptide repeat protein [Burkholderiaceae bacterium]|nr:tetratricopeptide repeat protein [Burkholderiaceae bacterium]